MLQHDEPYKHYAEGDQSQKKLYLYDSVYMKPSEFANHRDRKQTCTSHAVGGGKESDC